MLLTKKSRSFEFEQLLLLELTNGAQRVSSHKGRRRREQIEQSSQFGTLKKKLSKNTLNPKTTRTLRIGEGEHATDKDEGSEGKQRRSGSGAEERASKEQRSGVSRSELGAPERVQRAAQTRLVQQLSRRPSYAHQTLVCILFCFVF